MESINNSVTRHEKHTPLSEILLRMLVAFVLAYCAFLAVDFITHPFSAGANQTVGTPYLFRWLSFIAGTCTVSIALFIMMRVKKNIVGPLMLFYGVGAIGWSGRLDWESVAQQGWFTTTFALYFYALALPSIFALFFYFPTGRAYPPRFQGWVLVVCIGMGILGLFAGLGTPPEQQSGAPNPLYYPLFEPVGYLYSGLVPFALLTSLVTVFLRYRRGGMVERLQLKWALYFGGIIVVISLIISSIPQDTAIDSSGAATVALLRVMVFILWQSFAAFSFGIAMLRYKLWDIDLIIRRTVTYALVTALLGLVFFGSVILLQQLFSSITGAGQNEIVTVLSTLAIAALFAPVRNRVQSEIDKRFNRKKYDAQQVLADFGKTVRDETDLEQLTARLMQVVDETMQPKSVSVWLRKQEGRVARERSQR